VGDRVRVGRQVASQEAKREGWVGDSASRRLTVRLSVAS
jgi:hypothetical protein